MGTEEAEIQPLFKNGFFRFHSRTEVQRMTSRGNKQKIGRVSISSFSLFSSKIGSLNQSESNKKWDEQLLLWKISFKIFSIVIPLKIIKEQLYFPVLLPGLFLCRTGTKIAPRVSSCYEKTIFVPQ